MDTNSDGVLSFNELVATFGRDGALRLMGSTDHNGDNMITIAELRRGPDEDRDDGARRDTSDETDDDDDRDDDDRDDDDGDEGGDDGGGDSDGGGDDGDGDDD
ncbi:hypothetical protein KUV51_18850 [Tateyamaria omphalii]|nr:hypothetical protein [Tateyamaria omphalii]